MATIGIIRCEKSLSLCPLSSCLRCISSEKSFAGAPPLLAGIVTCRCPGDGAVDLASQLKAKGAEIIHFCTCAFAEKTEIGWVREGVFCKDIDRILLRISRETGIPCKKVVAPLPEVLIPHTRDFPFGYCEGC